MKAHNKFEGDESESENPIILLLGEAANKRVFLPLSSLNMQLRDASGCAYR